MMIANSLTFDMFMFHHIIDSDT